MLVGAFGVEMALIVTGLVLPVAALLALPFAHRLDDAAVVPEHRAALLRVDPAVLPAPARRARAARDRDAPGDASPPGRR